MNCRHVKRTFPISTLTEKEPELRLKPTVSGFLCHFPLTMNYNQTLVDDSHLSSHVVELILNPFLVLSFISLVNYTDIPTECFEISLLSMTSPVCTRPTNAVKIGGSKSNR